VETVENKKPPNAGKGRQKGVPNKLTRDLKDMTFNALNRAGGEDYLLSCALDNPKAFLAFLGRFIPSEVKQTVTTVEHLSDDELDEKIAEKLAALNVSKS
jgi:hypothetical protein